MKRTVITVDGNGMLSIPSNLQDLWMSEGELVDMLHVTAMKLHAVIRLVLIKIIPIFNNSTFYMPSLGTL